jgi:hypothetical protein
LWLSQPQPLSRAEIEHLARDYIQRRADRLNETAQVQAISLNRARLGQTPIFQRTCNTLPKIAAYTQLFFRGNARLNWCDPLLAVWEVRLLVRRGEGTATLSNFYLIFTTTGRHLDVDTDANLQGR